MYNAQELFKTFSSKSTKLPVGIHTGVQLVSVLKEDGYVEFNFKHPDGSMNKRLWTPSGKFPRKEETPADAEKRQELENLEFIVNTVVAIAGEEALSTINASTYDGMVDKAIALIEKNKAKHLVNLKVIYDSKGAYTETPTSGSIERYEEGVEPALKFSNWEMTNRMTRKEQLTNANKEFDLNSETLGKDDPFSDLMA